LGNPCDKPLTGPSSGCRVGRRTHEPRDATSVRL
jgi:hypothetical protein